MNLNVQIATFYMWQFTFGTNYAYLCCARSTYSKRLLVATLANNCKFLLGKMKGVENGLYFPIPIERNFVNPQEEDK